MESQTVVREYFFGEVLKLWDEGRAEDMISSEM